MTRPPRSRLLALAAAALALTVTSHAGASGFQPEIDGALGLRTPFRPTLPTPGTPFFVNEYSALSWNALILSLTPELGTVPTLPSEPRPNPLVLLNLDPSDLPLRENGCSFIRLDACSNVQEFLAELDLRAGGNGQFGRRDLGIWTPIVGISPITFGQLICNTSVGLSDPSRCDRPGAAVPEPSGALVFAAGLAVAAARRRPRG